MLPGARIAVVTSDTLNSPEKIHAFVAAAVSSLQRPSIEALNQAFVPHELQRAASTLANCRISRSRTMFDTRKSGSPACRVPKNSPGPRSCKSNSAISKPLLVRTIASSR